MSARCGIGSGGNCWRFWMGHEIHQIFQTQLVPHFRQPDTAQAGKLRNVTAWFGIPYPPHTGALPSGSLAVLPLAVL